MAEKNAPTSLQFNNSNNSPVLAEAAWLPSMDAGLVWEIQQNIIFGQLNSLGSFILLIIVIALIAMALMTWAGTRRVFKPLQSLTAITSKFAAGDFSVRAEVHSQNELACWPIHSITWLRNLTETLSLPRTKSGRTDPSNPDYSGGGATRHFLSKSR